MAIASETRTVVGVFNSVQDAQAAVRELETQGISRDDISIVANKNATGYDTMDAADRDKASDVVADAGIGAAIGGVGGLLLSVAGAITLPVIGPILAAGPIAAALTGAGIGAATGGLIGALTEHGVPEEDARYYAEGVRRGDVLVTVRATGGRADEVCDVLDRHNAIDVDDRVQDWQQRGWSGYRDDAKPFTADELRSERTHYSSGIWGQNTGSLTGETGIGVDRQRAALHSDRDDLTPGYNATDRTADKLDEWKEDAKDAGRELKRDTRNVMERTGDKLHEWKEDVKDSARDLRDEARSNERDMRSSGGDATQEMKRDVREMGRDINDVMHGRTGKQPHDIAEDRREAERRRRARVYDRST